MKYEMEVNEFSVDIIEYGKTIFHNRSILTVHIDEDPNEARIQMEDLRLITAALNAYEKTTYNQPE